MFTFTIKQRVQFIQNRNILQISQRNYLQRISASMWLCIIVDLGLGFSKKLHKKYVLYDICGQNFLQS